MTLREFIDEHRGELDKCIRNAVGDQNFDIDDDEREMWIANDEGLYEWARSEGVDMDEEEE